MTSHYRTIKQCEAASGGPSTQAASRAAKKVLKRLAGPCKFSHFQLYSHHTVVIASKKAITTLCLVNTKKAPLLRPNEASTVAGKQASRLRLKQPERRTTAARKWCCGEASVASAIETMRDVAETLLSYSCGEASVASAIETHRRCLCRGRKQGLRGSKRRVCD